MTKMILDRLSNELSKIIGDELEKHSAPVKFTLVLSMIDPIGEISATVGTNFQNPAAPFRMFEELINKYEERVEKGFRN